MKCVQRVQVARDAPHVLAHHRGDTADVLERRALAFGREWLRVRYEDGCEQWVLLERVEEVFV